MTGASVTVMMAAVVVALPPVFVNTASYSLPFISKVAAKVSVVEEAPVSVEKLAPPLLLTCHCTVGAGFPLAVAVKVTELPAVTVWLFGWIVMAGVVFTMRVTAVVVALPAALLKIA